MKKYLTVIASFLIMLCIGSIYAWSIIAAQLIENYNLSAFQTQLIFGNIVALFPLTMIFVGQLGLKVKPRVLGYISGLLLLFGYLFAGFSKGNFLILLLGLGVFTGIGTGFGYWTCFTLPVLWFPKKKGLIAGITAAGFGLGAVFMSEIAEIILNKGYNVLQLFSIIGFSYGGIILVASNFIFPIEKIPQSISQISPKDYIKTKMFRKLFLGLFLGTFSGLLIIGSLLMIGGQYSISNHILVLGIVIFAIANFLGRIIWGYLSDFIDAKLCIFLALLFQSLAILSLNVFNLIGVTFLVVSFLIGFGFGGNFVLFAKETAQKFGVRNLGLIYPYIFTGYAIAGIIGPLSGGMLYDYFGSYFFAILLASLISFLGCLLFLKEFFESKKIKIG